MKHSKSSIHSKTHAIPELRFEEQKLTSFSGLTVFQQLFDFLSLKSILSGCFKHRTVNSIFGDATIVMLLVVHMLLGYREIRHIKFYENDPMVKRILGLTRLPDVSTVSRCLSSMDAKSVNQLQQVIGDGVLNRLVSLSTSRITLDFDGSVIGTGRFAEGTAVGFNKKKKGQCSYYPLFCTVAQTGQVLNILHRSGNIHDSNGAPGFIQNCVDQVRKVLPNVIVEVRMDSAFFSDELVSLLEACDVEYTISVPFERLLELKGRVEKRRKWCYLDKYCDFFDIRWKPKSWKYTRRFIAVRQATKIQMKTPVQLDLFTPSDYQWEYKVVITNKILTAKNTVAYHNGRGSQENIFGELKSSLQMDYVPTRTWEGNKVYLLSAVLAHNLTRELQMISSSPVRTTQEKRPTLWKFKALGTLRRQIIQRAGRIIQPQGKLVLSMAKNDAVKDEMLHYLDTIGKAA
ncbi:IS1380 family transposase [Teredinibacter haidensis]|uniref:IS1380 family transposase n=1 Tax=Teredinibacter haidensis TaxID=2731755 RepID=UPI000948B14E|nr:IS1380 family transposase [Teredinibacter haidensis]